MYSPGGTSHDIRRVPQPQVRADCSIGVFFGCRTTSILSLGADGLRALTQGDRQRFLHGCGDLVM